jgi:hypothetical protein
MCFKGIVTNTKMKSKVMVIIGGQVRRGDEYLQNFSICELLQLSY